MRLRLELFVENLDTSIAFYTGVLGFELRRRSDGYASLRHGSVVLGLGSIAELPAAGGPGFSQARLRAAGAKGAGVEIVLETDDLTALHDRCAAAGAVVEPLRSRPWGLTDFRITDPDGYYLRITHGDATTD
jgi:catechol 2,3-dioxygenase-like lactoylglutathione lyase family enzyme